MATAIRTMKKAGRAPSPPAADVVNALQDPVIAFGASLEVTFVNEAALSLFGRAASLRDIFGPQSLVLNAAARAVAAGRAVTLHDIAAGGVDAHKIVITPMQGGCCLALSRRAPFVRADRADRARHALRPAQFMARTLAHEIKNPLAGIQAAAQLLARGVTGAEDRELLGLISKETDRILRLVRKVDVFGESSAAHFAPVNIHAVLNRAARMARAAWPCLEVAEEYDPSLPELYGDFDLLVQAVMNLVKNAAEAARGKVILRTFYDHDAPRHPESREKLPLCAEVIDDGPGIPPGALDSIFDPYYTTKPGGEGLGLAIVSKIADDHGGAVDAQSGGGRTVFRLAFPQGREA